MKTLTLKPYKGQRVRLVFTDRNGTQKEAVIMFTQTQNGVAKVAIDEVVSQYGSVNLGYVGHPK